MRILLAEDERELADALTAILKHDGYLVDAVYDGEEAVSYGLADNYDCVILDIMMPKKSGLDALRELRAAGVKTPVLILTARGQLEDKVAGLDLGADDYLTKPFAAAELLARLRARLRRRGDIAPDVLQVGDLTLDRATRLLTGPRGAVQLANKEFQMLSLLMESGKRLISTEQFMDRIWGYDSEAGLNVVWVYISYIRRKLESLGSRVAIKAMRGAGYTLEERNA